MKIYIISIILLLMVTISKSALVLKQEKSSETLTAECLGKYVNDVAKGETMFISEDVARLTEVSKESVYQLMKHGTGSRMYSIEVQTCVTRRKCRGKTLPYQQYLIFANSSARLRYVLEECLCSEYSPAAKFIIVANQTSDSLKMLDVLKTNHIYVAVIVTSLHDNNIIYNYVNPRCPDIDISNQSFHYNCLSSDKEQVPIVNVKAFMKCRLTLGIRYAFPYTQKPLNQAYRHYAGIELFILSLILPYRPTEPFDISDIHELGTYDKENKTGTGLIKELLDENVDFLVGALHADKRFPFVETSYPVIRAKIIGVVKKRKDFRLLTLLRVFDWKVWLLVFILILVFIFIKYVLMVHNHDQPCDMQYTLFNIYAIFIGQDADLTKKYLRLAILSWIWIAFIFRTSYEAYSTLLFIAKDSSNQVDTLDEVCRDNYTIFVSDINYAYFSDGLQLSDCFIPPENFHEVENPREEMLKMESDLVAVFMYDRAYLPDLESFIEQDGSSPFHIMKEIVNDVPLVYYFRHGDPLVDLFRKRILLLEQTSLLRFYENIIDTKRHIDTAAKHRTLEKKLSLSMDHVIIGFYLGLCGASVSIIVFIMEWIVFRFM